MDLLFGFFFGSPGIPEMVIIGVIAVLLFGSRLPEVGRSLGRGLIEFKKGLHGVTEEDEPSTTTARSTSYETIDAPESEDPSAPQFTPPSE
jgi:sec-independent protein translocase protein TatA